MKVNIKIKLLLNSFFLVIKQTQKYIIQNHSSSLIYDKELFLTNLKQLLNEEITLLVGHLNTFWDKKKYLVSIEADVYICLEYSKKRQIYSLNDLLKLSMEEYSLTKNAKFKALLDVSIKIIEKYLFDIVR